MVTASVLHSADSTRAGRARMRLIARTWDWRLDMLCFIMALLFMVFMPPIERHAIPLRTVLSLRVSLFNVLFGILCVLSWRLVQIVTLVNSGSSLRKLSSVGWSVGWQVTGCAVFLGLILWIFHPQVAVATYMAVFWLLAAALLILSRAFFFVSNALITPWFRIKRQVVIVGSGPRAREMAQQLQSHPRWDYHLLGFVDSDPQSSGLEILGGVQDLEAILMQRPVDEVIITLPVKSKYDDIQTAITVCERAGVQSGYSLDLFAIEVTKRRALDTHDASSVILHMVHNDNRRVLKRAFDLLGALMGLLLLSPVLVLVAALIKLTSPGPMIFRQQRYGLNKRKFTMYKFRSMVFDAEERQSQYEHLNETSGPVFKIRKDPRITPIGRMIRQSSIDEIPQLVNVLRGEMSLVGPRPLPMRDVGNFSEAWLMRRFSVRPGITGLWQVSGRSNATFANWIKLDLEYIDRWTLLLDVKILVRTFPAVLKRDGAV